MFAVLTTDEQGLIVVLFEGTRTDCEKFEIDWAGCWSMRITPGID